jgi:hypothetical protein
VALIDRAEHEIDLAAYVLTDWPILQAFTRVADRGVQIRIYLDGSQLTERERAKVFWDLAETPGVEIRIKRKSSDPMHLKSLRANRVAPRPRVIAAKLAAVSCHLTGRGRPINTPTVRHWSARRS